jgi:hypothetical protein
MFQKSPEPSFQKKLEDTIDEYGKFIVEEVLHVVEIDGIINAYVMFQEFEQHTHCQVIKQLYY